MNSEIQIRIDGLVSEIACCDRDGCRCYEAVATLQRIEDYVKAELTKHAKRVGLTK